MKVYQQRNGRFSVKQTDMQQLTQTQQEVRPPEGAPNACWDTEGDGGEDCVSVCGSVYVSECVCVCVCVCE